MTAPIIPPVPPAIQRAHAEQEYAAELETLARLDDRQRPPGWLLSPWAVVTYIAGGKLADGSAIVAEVHRRPAAHRDRRRHPRHRPRAAAARRPGHRQDVDV